LQLKLNALYTLLCAAEADAPVQESRGIAVIFGSPEDM